MPATIRHARRGPRIVVVVATAPIWVWVLFVAAPISGLHSMWIWIRTGKWLLADELPRWWIYRVADTTEAMIRRGVRSADPDMNRDAR